MVYRRQSMQTQRELISVSDIRVWIAQGALIDVFA